jgi:sortase (surface protein transpeptidase)
MKHRTLRNVIAAGVVSLVLAAPASADTIYIPKIKLFTPIATSLDYGPIKWYQDEDTVALAGHRTTHSKPFSGLEKLAPGDLIRTGGKNYRVAKTVIIRPWQMWILNWKGLVLSACSLPNGMPTSGSYRIVVLAK